MARLIDIDDVARVSSPLLIRVGDVLIIRAAGGKSGSGAGIVKVWGTFTTAVVGSDSSVIAPIGAPNAVVCQALAVGEAEVEVFMGDAFRPPIVPTILRFSVEK